MRIQYVLIAATVTSVVTLAVAIPVQAYIGPGAGLTAIGAALALVGAVIAAIFGFVWYPVKRLLGHWRGPASTYRDPPQA